MPGIVEFPQLVQRAVEGFGDLFYGEPQRQHFGEYLTGLFVADRKTVSGINREFAHTTDQSCLNRFLTEVDWDVQALNERRLDFFQQDSTTRYSDAGVIAIDNVLIDHTGKCIEDVGWFWDHAARHTAVCVARGKRRLFTLHNGTLQPRAETALGSATKSPTTICSPTMSVPAASTTRWSSAVFAKKNSARKPAKFSRITPNFASN